jgi:hypothetical protein
MSANNSSSTTTTQQPTNFFQNVLNDADQVEQELLGPDYAYYKQIKSPEQMGMSAKGSIGALTSDIEGLIGYVELLSVGGGKASVTGGPLGNKFFLETGAKCTDKATGNKVTRSLYVNNVPDGSIPFVSAGLDGTNFSTFEGLIPGVMSNLAHINPMQIFQSFMTGSNPECQAIEMETIDVNNFRGTQTAFVTTNDIQSMSPCWFKNKTNPVTGQKCKEAFGPMNANTSLNASKIDYSKMPNDLMVKLYYSSYGLLILYIFFKLFKRGT